MTTMILGLVGETNVNRPEPETAFTKVQGMLDKADVLFGHFETTLSENPSDNDDMPDLPFKRGWRHSKPENARAWKTAGFDAVGVASNVSGSVESTVCVIRELDKLGIPHAGVGLNIAEAHKPAIVEKNGVRFGFLSYTSVFYRQFVPALGRKPGAATVKAEMSIVPSWRTEEMPGAMPSVKTWLEENEKASMLEDIAGLRPQVDVVVLSNHWGVSSDEKIQDYQIEFAHSAIDAGADVIIGHHPHRPQGIEIYKGKPVFYSMGNFAFDWQFLRHNMKEGIIAYVSFTDGAIAKCSFAPVRREDESNDVAPLPLGSKEGLAVVETVRRLSRPFGVEVEAVGEEAVVRLPKS